MKGNKPVVAVVGATGAVGKEMLLILESRDFPVAQVRAFASERSVGEKVPFQGGEIVVDALTEDSFEGIDLALFSAGKDTSEKFTPCAVKAGCVVIDNSTAWRMDPSVPLVVPEVNPDDLKWHRGVIANPNCSTIQMVAVLKPLHDAATIQRIVISTYQAVSESGQKGISELESQILHLMNGQDADTHVYPHQIAFNCLPHIDSFLDNDYTKEEMRMVKETRKILGDDSLRITATACRVPVFYGQSESVNIETAKKLTPKEARAILCQTPGVEVFDNPHENIYPMPFAAVGEDSIFVGRIREDESIERGLNLWIVADNIRKGAALNAVQIAEKLLEMDLLRVS
ncbi:MAG: aspartate-semialdehyde dehydrogenase [Desulfoplanes sp.]